MKCTWTSKQERSNEEESAREIRGDRKERRKYCKTQNNEGLRDTQMGDVLEREAVPAWQLAIRAVESGSSQDNLRRA